MILLRLLLLLSAGLVLRGLVRAWAGGGSAAARNRFAAADRGARPANGGQGRRPYGAEGDIVDADFEEIP